MDKEFNYSGKLETRDNSEGEEVLFLSSLKDPLAETMEEDFGREHVTVRYWITDKDIGKDKIQQDLAMVLLGAATPRYHIRYSDITGYLYTDEEIKIGGHDLLEELKSYNGSWLHLEVIVHPNNKP